ncbi:hypothetical protein [Motilibacter aurantiacus]|uniref:hypothetical protein n=1 Tax=Motilibacter aurantiacus TaxID=2714955 RepID=UPI001409B656|nr:hypothetical protein [Motilibacter aurantiacus]NHC44523.1 hypothetical protein [Motilibacter aurantiacus]
MLLVLSWLLQVVPAEAADIEICGPKSCEGDGWVVGEEATTPGSAKDGGSSGGAAAPGAQKPYIEKAYTPACDGNKPEEVVDSGCTRATTGCGVGQLNFWVWRRTVDPVAGTRSDWQQGGMVCRSPRDPTEEDPRATLPQIVAAFKALTVPVARPQIQPSGRSLVGLDTIFYTRVGAQTWTDVLVAVEQIDFTATPERYIWHFGDGTELTTTDPGKPYPNQTITHQYKQSGARVSPSVTVVWAGKYRHHDETTWHEVPERVEADGPSVTLEVASAASELVSGEQ